MNGDELKHWRDEHGLKKAELARRLDVPYQTLDRWERGHMEIRHGRILALALWALERGAGEEHEHDDD